MTRLCGDVLQSIHQSQTNVPEWSNSNSEPQQVTQLHWLAFLTALRVQLIVIRFASVRCLLIHEKCCNTRTEPRQPLPAHAQMEAYPALDCGGLPPLSAPELAPDESPRQRAACRKAGASSSSPKNTETQSSPCYIICISSDEQRSCLSAALWLFPMTRLGEQSSTYSRSITPCDTPGKAMVPPEMAALPGLRAIE
ncbi:hypothetical protein BH11VER1_BH11VER1_03640 [soil metagenome]